MSKRRRYTPRRRQPNRAMTIVQIFLLIVVLFVILNIRFKFGEGASMFFETLTAPDVDVTQQAPTSENPAAGSEQPSKKPSTLAAPEDSSLKPSEDSQND